MFRDAYNYTTMANRFLFSLLVSVITPNLLVNGASEDHFSNPNGLLCHDRFGFLNQTNYRRRACVLCYTYLFPKGTKLFPYRKDFETLVPKRKWSSVILSPISPDPQDEVSLQKVCATLEEDQCVRWRTCCIAAALCCKKQLTQPRVHNQGDGHCPRTWDGFSCWEDTPAGQTVAAECPSFLYHVVPNRVALKTCTANATWFEKKGMAWTDYRPCLDKKSYINITFLSLGCNVTSIVLLLPAILVYFYFKDLLSQHRIRLHINLSVSLTLGCVMSILWDILIRYDKITNPIAKGTIMNRNTPACKCVSALKIYFTSTTYFWMFCEAYYLHRLIIKAFQPPSSLFILYLIGWGIPVLHTVAYCITRAILDDKNCWAYSLGNFEWIIYTPNLTCLLFNVFYLCNILRILMFKLHSHSSEPGSFRRGLRAGFMLIPLFGLQMFLTIYRVPVGARGQRAYEIITVIVKNSQGIFVSIIFCFLNSEVMSKLKIVRSCWRHLAARRLSRTISHTNNIAWAPRECNPPPECHAVNGKLPETVNMINANAKCEDIQLKSNRSVRDREQNESFLPKVYVLSTDNINST